MWRIFNLLPGRRRRMEQALERELRHHLDSRIEDLLRAGLSGAEARRQAALEFGGIARVQEEVRETWTWRWADVLGRDIRYGGRTLSRNRGFTLTAVLSLALGIGASTAIFSLVDQVLLRGLPVHEPGRLVQLAWVGNSLTATWGSGHLVSYPLCRDLHEQQQFFEGAFCRSPATVNISIGQQHDHVRAEIVSGSYFGALGASAALGRLIDESDDRVPGASPVVVLSHRYWQSQLGGARDVIGRTVLVRNYPMTVIGIAPADFNGMDPLAAPAVWIPAMMAPQAAPLEPGWNRVLSRRIAWMHVFARLKPGVTAEDAKHGLQPWFSAMVAAESPGEGFHRVPAEDRRAFLASTIDVLPAAQGVSNLRALLERPLLVLMAGAALLMLLACLNVAGLLLARGAARGAEFSTRIALGASRPRLTSQLVVESTLLTLGGGVLGLVAAPVVSRVLLSFLTYADDVPLRFDRRAFLFAFLISVLTGVLCALAPLLQTGRVPLAALLKEQSRNVAGARVRLRKALVAGQIALTLLLLIAAGLFVQTVAHLQSKTGFGADSQVLFSVSPTSIGYTEADAERAMREVLRRVREIPDIENAGVANTSLLTGGWSARNLTIQSEERIVSERPVPFMRVSPGFFPALGTQVIAGRDFDERDVRAPGSPPREWQSVIVNESFVRRYFNGRNPVGHRLGSGNEPGTVTNIEIIGVVRDFSRRSLRDESIEQAFFPYWDRDSDGGTFYVRVRGKPESAFGAIRAAVEQVDPALPISSMLTFSDQVDRSIWSERALARLVTAFGVIALLLSIIGLYGVISFVVTQRRRELGLRLALGATRSAALWLITRDALIMVGAGIAVALPAAWALRRLVEAQLFGVRALDATTIALASGMLTLLALGAAIRPAWRAASISPGEALRLD